MIWRSIFCEIEKAGIVLDDAQKRWYIQKKAEKKHAMKEEYPTVPSEAFEVNLEGAIYGAIIDELAENGCINCRFNTTGMSPLYVLADIGMSDTTALWLLEETKAQHRIVDCIQFSGKPVAHTAAVIKGWEELHGRIEKTLLPHDAVQRDKASAVTYEQRMREAGIQNILVVPRTPDIWVGIDETREFLVNCVFHERCDKVIMDGTTKLPSGLDALRSYRKKPVSANGIIQTKPHHDIYSNFADALRTGGSGYKMGYISPDFIDMKKFQKPRRALG